MLCGVNFQNNFIKGHNPLYFETQEGLISFENETYTFYWLAHLFNIIISIFLTFWIVLFLMLIQKSEKLISHLKNVSPINTSGQAHDTTSWFVHLFFSDISSSLWLHLRTSYWFQSDINIFYYFCGMEVNKLSFCIFTGFFFSFLRSSENMFSCFPKLACKRENLSPGPWSGLWVCTEAWAGSNLCFYTEY